MHNLQMTTFACILLQLIIFVRTTVIDNFLCTTAILTFVCTIIELVVDKPLELLLQLKQHLNPSQYP